MSVLPSIFKNAVVALGVLNGQNPDPTWIGTGFLIGERTEDKRAYLYLVSNKHVFDGNANLVMYVNRATGEGTVKINIPLYEKKGKMFSLHQDKDVDIAVMGLNRDALMKEQGQFNWFDLSDHTLTLQQMKHTGVDEGCLVHTIGFPLGRVDKNIKAPFVRLGCISRIDDAFNGVGDSTYYIDAQTFPGSSGSPVINRPTTEAINGTPFNNSARLIGILNSYIPYQEYLVNQQTKEVVEVRSENSGLTKVFPVDRILEVVDEERKRISKITPDWPRPKGQSFNNKNGPSRFCEKGYWGFEPVKEPGTHCNLIG